MSAFKDLSGTRFGKLLVIGRAEDHSQPSGHRESQYTCVCECGKTVVVRRKNLISGHTKSCGCKKKTRALPVKEKVAEVKKEPQSFDRCIYNPKAIECNDGFCSKCGWNPYNTALRKLRINRLLRKDGNNE